MSFSPHANPWEWFRDPVSAVPDDSGYYFYCGRDAPGRYAQHRKAKRNDMTCKFVDGRLFRKRSLAYAGFLFFLRKSDEIIKKLLTNQKIYAIVILPRIGRVFFMRLFICIPSPYGVPQG